jgi:CHAD domain-containing protein
LKRIVGVTVTHLLSNVGAANGGDVEGVHQIRVAVRRLRAALALFKQYLNPVTLECFNDELRRLGRLFGAARDWDVFVLETLSAAENSIPEPTVLDPLRKAAERERLAAHHAVCTELNATSFARVVIGIAASFADRASDLQRKEDNALNVPIADIAPDLLDRMARKVSKRGRHMDRASHEQLHASRKAIKKLRYSVEFLSSLHPRRAGQYTPMQVLAGVARHGQRRCRNPQSFRAIVKDWRGTCPRSHSIRGLGGYERQKGAPSCIETLA